MNKEQSRQGNVNKIYSWVLNGEDYPQHFSSAGYAFLRRYDPEKSYTSKALLKNFKIQNITWYENEKDFGKTI